MWILVWNFNVLMWSEKTTSLEVWDGWSLNYLHLSFLHRCITKEATPLAIHSRNPMSHHKVTRTDIYTLFSLNSFEGHKLLWVEF